MIQTEPEDIESIRERLRKMSDLELRQYGRAARDLSNPKKNFAAEPLVQASARRGASGMAQKTSAEAVESKLSGTARTFTGDEYRGMLLGRIPR